MVRRERDCFFEEVAVKKCFIFVNCEHCFPFGASKSRKLQIYPTTKLFTSCLPDQSPAGLNAGHVRLFPLMPAPDRSPRASVCGCAISQVSALDILRAAARTEPVPDRECGMSDRDSLHSNHYAVVAQSLSRGQHLCAE